MSSPTRKTFRVRFCVTDWYSIDVEAANPDSAIDVARHCYDQEGASHKYGFVIDISRGGESDWTAKEVQP